MPLTYRRPGVYIEESLLSNAGDISGATSVACFVGCAAKGPANEPVLVETWGDYVATFGGFITVTNPDTNDQALTYLPYSVYQYLQNGGRTAWVVRAVPGASAGTSAGKTVAGVTFADPLVAGNAFTLTAKSTGVWGQDLSYALRVQQTILDGTDPVDVVFTLQILLTTNGVTEVLETYPNISIAGSVQGTRTLAEAVNDLVSGSRYVNITASRLDVIPAETTNPVPFTGGTDPDLPAAGDLTTAAVTATAKLEGPIVLNIVGYLNDATAMDTATWAESWVGGSIGATSWTDRQDIFIVNDNAPPREAGASNASYKTVMTGNSSLGANIGDSYVASYGPWILMPNPLRAGAVIAVPPGGAVAGMMARIDATVGVFRAPAGVIAGLNNVVGVQTKFTDSEQGDLNSANINVIRSVVGAGIAVMGARTRKSFGPDRYVNQRRTLIYIREVMRRSTQFAVFENNDERLWSALKMAGDRVLRPLWEAGGLRGQSAAEAYFLRADDSVNTPASIAAGEVRMEVGVATEYPAEFVIIRITQFDRGSFTAEVQPRS